MLSPESRKATMLRIDWSMYAMLKAAAERDNRSVNQQIVYYIRRMLETESPLDPPAA